MRLKSLFSLSVMLILIGMGAAYARSPRSGVVTTQFNLSRFHSLLIRGHLQVVLQPRARGPWKVSIRRRAQQRVDVTQRHGVVRIRERGYYWSRRHEPKIVVQVPTLSTLRVSGNVTLQGTALKTKALTLQADNRGSIQLRGKINVSRLQQQGSGKIDLRWINSDRLTMRDDGSGLVTLAGKVRHFQIKMSGWSRLQARYTRAHEVLIQTEGWAVARVKPVKLLRAFAYGRSIVYYYSRPKQLVQYVKQRANILQVV